MKTSKTLNEQLEKLVADSNTLMQVAETEDRDLTNEETAEIEVNTAEFSRLSLRRYAA